MTYLSAEQHAQLLKHTAITPTGCVLWTGATNRGGYGVVKIGGRAGKTYLAHRLTYSLFVGPLVDGLQIDHLCRVRNCVAPAHLEQVDGKTNVRRSHAGWHRRDKAAALTHCPRGHEYTPENAARMGRNQTLVCRECARARSRDYWHRVRKYRSAR